MFNKRKIEENRENTERRLNDIELKLEAIAEHLDIEFEWTKENDPNYKIPSVHKIDVIKAVDKQIRRDKEIRYTRMNRCYY